MIVTYEGSTQLLPNPVRGHGPEAELFAAHFQNLIPYNKPQQFFSVFVSSKIFLH